MPEARGRQRLLAAPFLLPGDPGCQPLPDSAQPVLERRNTPCLGPELTPVSTEPHSRTGSAEGEVRVGGQPFCDHWSNVSPQPPGSYTHLLAKYGPCVYACAMAPVVFLAGIAAAPSRRGELTNGRFSRYSSNQLLEATTSNRRLNTNRLDRWSRSKLGATPQSRTTNYYFFSRER